MDNSNENIHFHIVLTDWNGNVEYTSEGRPLVSENFSRSSRFIFISPC